MKILCPLLAHRNGNNQVKDYILSGFTLIQVYQDHVFRLVIRMASIASVRGGVVTMANTIRCNSLWHIFDIKLVY